MINLATSAKSESNSSLLRWYISTAPFHLAKIDPRNLASFPWISRDLLIPVGKPATVRQTLPGKSSMAAWCSSDSGCSARKLKILSHFYGDRLLMKQSILLRKYLFQIFFITALSYLSIPKYCPANLEALIFAYNAISTGQSTFRLIILW